MHTSWDAHAMRRHVMRYTRDEMHTRWHAHVMTCTRDQGLCDITYLCMTWRRWRRRSRRCQCISHQGVWLGRIVSEDVSRWALQVSQDISRWIVSQDVWRWIVSQDESLVKMYEDEHSRYIHHVWRWAFEVIPCSLCVRIIQHAIWLFLMPSVGMY